MQKPKKLVEPFPLFGVESIFHSKEHAAKVLKSNSYYIFVAGIIGIILYIVLRVNEPGLKSHHNLILINSIIHLINGFFIKELQSRIASILSLLLFLYNLFLDVADGEMNVFFLFGLIFCAASFRSIKASFYYHKN